MIATDKKDQALCCTSFHCQGNSMINIHSGAFFFPWREAQRNHYMSLRLRGCEAEVERDGGGRLNYFTVRAHDFVQKDPPQREIHKDNQIFKLKR